MSEITSVDQLKTEGEAKDYLASLINPTADPRKREREQPKSPFQREHELDIIFGALKKYPVLAATNFPCRMVHHLGILNPTMKPLSLLLKKRAPLSTIEAVYKMYPNALKQRSGPFGSLPILDAIWSSFEVLSFVASKYPEAVQQKDRRGNNPLAMLVRYLPKSQIESYGREDFAKRFKLLLELSNDDAWNKNRDDSYLALCWGRVFSALLESPNTPESLLAWLACRVGSKCALNTRFQPKNNQTFLKKFGIFISHLQPSCKMLELDDNFDENATDYLFSQVQFPDQLTLRSSYCLLSTETDTKWKTSSLQSLSIGGCPSNRAAALLPKLGLLPKLKKLELFQFRWEDSTSAEGVVGLLLSGSSRLDSLIIRGDAFLEEAADEIAAALCNKKCSTSPYIRVYECISGEGVKFNQQIAYLSSLNRHGRAKIAAPGATSDCLIVGLSSLADDTIIRENAKPAVAFGLLLENPGLWSSQEKASNAKAEGALRRRKRPMQGEDTNGKPKRSTRRKA